VKVAVTAALAIHVDESENIIITPENSWTAQYFNSFTTAFSSNRSYKREVIPLQDMLDPVFDYQFRLILIGDTTVGKSTLLRYFTDGKFSEVRSWMSFQTVFNHSRMKYLYFIN
jgi:GTPase SAR1 family protein